MSAPELTLDPPADPALEDRPFSLGLLAVMAAVWASVAAAFFISWLPEAEPTGPSWRSAALWYGLNYALWFVLSPVVFLLSRRFPPQGERRGRNLSVHFVAALALAMTHVVIFLTTEHGLDPEFHRRFASLAEAFKNNFLYRTLTGVVTYGLVLMAFVSDGSLRRIRREEKRSESLQRQLAQAQLQALRMQIQPHFLFNTLHSISSLIDEAPAQAHAMVARLGDFLRATLERGAVQTLRLAEELRFAELYLDIEKVRFADRLRVRIEVPPEVLDACVPPLILQPLVENAIRHGVAPALARVELTLSAAKRGGELEIVVRNVEAGAGATPPRPGDGLGLANTRARLRQAYGDEASLLCASLAPGAYEAILRLPIEGPADGGH